MFENVLVGVDGRAGGRDAIALATRLLAQGGQMALAHVHSGVPRTSRNSPPGAPSAARESVRLLQAQREEAQVAAELISVLSSSPGRGLHEIAEQRGADLIVVGSCARGLIGRTMLGDDARGALNGAPCAVAVAVRGYAEHPLPLQDVGVGYDGSPESEAALAAARGIAAPHRSKLTALQVVTIPSYAFTGVAAPSLGESIELMVADAQKQMDELEDVEGRAVYGLPGEELCKLGEQVDLLVLGSRSYGPVRRLMLGSTSNQLQRHGRSSLLVLPRTAATAHGTQSTPTEVGTLQDQETTDNEKPAAAEAGAGKES